MQREVNLGWGEAPLEDHGGIPDIAPDVASLGETITEDVFRGKLVRLRQETPIHTQWLPQLGFIWISFPTTPVGRRTAQARQADNDLAVGR